MLIGIDEAGRGPVLGPMVVAGVLVDDESKLVALQVKDSKKLTPARREFLAGEIGKVAKYELKVVPAEDIDQLRALMTMNALEAKLFASIIETLEPPEGTMIFVDSADTDEDNFKALIQKELMFEADIVSKHKADEMYPVVSAASIIAKTRRDEEVERIRKELGREIGSGYPSDETTIKFIEEWIAEHGDLPPHTRRSWETARRLMSLHKVKRF